jgi:tetratricopeptide (TPR) repeat protein
MASTPKGCHGKSTLNWEDLKMAENPDLWDHASNLHAEALEQARAGHYDKALPLLIESVRLKFFFGPDTDSFRTGLLNLGRAYFETGDLATGHRILLEALERAYMANAQKGLILDVLGQLHHDGGRGDLALAYYLRASILLGREYDSEAPYELRALSNAALACVHFGSPFEEAIDLAGSVVPLLRERQDKHTVEQFEADLNLALIARKPADIPREVLEKLSPQDRAVLERFSPARDDRRIPWMTQALKDEGQAETRRTMEEVEQLACSGRLGELFAHEPGRWVMMEESGPLRHEIFVFGPRMLAITSFPQMPLVAENLNALEATNFAWNLHDELELQTGPLGSGEITDLRVIAPFYADHGCARLGFSGLLRLGADRKNADVVEILAEWRQLSRVLTSATIEIRPTLPEQYLPLYLATPDSPPGVMNRRDSGPSRPRSRKKNRQ